MESSPIAQNAGLAIIVSPTELGTMRRIDRNPHLNAFHFHTGGLA